MLNAGRKNVPVFLGRLHASIRIIHFFQLPQNWLIIIYLMLHRVDDKYTHNLVAVKAATEGWGSFQRW